jgi:hypothetical protein
MIAASSSTAESFTQPVVCQACDIIRLVPTTVVTKLAK